MRKAANRMLADEVLRIRDTMIIRYVHRWGGAFTDSKWWEGTINGEVHDWHRKEHLIADAKKMGIAFIVMTYHKDGTVSIKQRG